MRKPPPAAERRSPTRRVSKSRRNRAGSETGAPSASIIIPVFNQAALTRQCLETILAGVQASACSPGKLKLELQLIVVNDASTDHTAKMLATFGEKIKVVSHKKNSGFAKSCNDGAKIARGKFLVFLNNDTIPQRGWLAALVNHAEKNPKAAVVGAKLVYPNNTIQHAGVIICQDKYPRHIYTGFPAEHPAVSQSRRFQIVTAAAMLVRKNIFTAARGFDTKFRNGFEDVDLCLRLGERGHEIHYCAESVVQHLESVSPNRFKHDRRNVALYRKRWFHKVQPDDLKFFIADGLLQLNYEGQFPLHLKISPELAVVDAGRKNEIEKNLAVKNRQLADLTRDMTKLVVELGGGAKKSAAMEYARLRSRLRKLVAKKIPRGGKILVVSKGDGALLELGGRAAEHFPQSATGGYAGFHPADGKAAVAELKKLSPRFDFLVLPQTSRWWLEHYREFNLHLRRHARLVVADKTTGNIYQLNG